MKFKRYERWSFRETEGIRKAFVRKCDRQVEAAGMFADDVRANLLPVEAEMDRRRDLALRTEASWRVATAACWQRGRRDYFSLPEDLREAFRKEWAAFMGPATAVYFCDVLLAFRRVHGLAPKADFSHMHPKPRQEIARQLVLPLADVN